MAGLTNQYLEDLGKRVCGKSFLGVFPCDVQPQLDKRLNKFSIIFNTDKHNEKGEHFIAIYCNRKEIFYFDSFGKKCKNKYIKKFIKNNTKKRKFVSNSVCIQNKTSLFCGLFSVAFINSKMKKIPFAKFISKFSKQQKGLNDFVVTKMITDAV